MSGHSVLSLGVACFQSGRLSVRQQVEQIKCSYLSSKSIVPARESPVIPGSTFTQEQVAVMLADDMFRNKPMPRMMKQKLGRLLHNAIRRLVYKNASSYVKSCPDTTVDDLAQDCFHKMMKCLWQFDPSKARFTTWVWPVCRSVLNKKYRQGLKSRNVVIYVGKGVDDNMDEHDNFIVPGLAHQFDEVDQSHECSGVMAGEIVTAIRALESKYPQNQPLIRAIFGDFDSPDFLLPSSMVVSEAAKSIGMDAQEAHAWHAKVLVPFLRKELAGCYTP